MLSINRCLCATQKSCSLVLEVYCSTKLKSLMPLRTISYKYGVKTQDKAEKYQIKALTGYDDPNFTENLKVVLLNPKIFKQGLVNFKNEVKTFFKEEAANVNNNLNPVVDDKRGRIDILYKFEKPEDLDGFSVNTDSSFSAGYSSAVLKITQEETAEFCGHICEDVPKDGNVKVAGFANMMCPTQNLAFFRKRRYNWTEYTHLVLKIRGDGRTYLVLLHVPDYYTEAKYHMYAQPLYTRGGPYWQIVKMPFSHFFFMVKGAIPAYGQSAKVSLSRILRMGITASAYEGPFKLEIDYIGLTYDEKHKTTSPYEEYRN